MIVRRFEDILPSPRAVHADNWSSFRLLTRDDGMGFSLHETWIHPGTKTHIWYRHHFEAVYCIEGEGEVELVDSSGQGCGKPVALKAGVMYALDAHDRHILRAHTRLRLICVFNPALRGDETHGPDGAYAPAEDDSGSSGDRAVPESTPARAPDPANGEAGNVAPITAEATSTAATTGRGATDQEDSR